MSAMIIIGTKSLLIFPEFVQEYNITENSKVNYLCEFVIPHISITDNL